MAKVEYIECDKCGEKIHKDGKVYTIIIERQNTSAKFNPSPFAREFLKQYDLCSQCNYNLKRYIEKRFKNKGETDE